MSHSDRHNDLRRMTFTDEPSMSTWSTTPEIILVRIFEDGALAALHDCDLPFPILVTHICRRWRSVAQLSPSVWCNIPVHIGTTGLTTFLLNHVGTTAPISICLHVGISDSAFRHQDYNLKLLLANAKRIVRLHLRAHHPSSVFYISNLLRGLANSTGLPALKHLEIVATTPGGSGELALPLSIDCQFPLRTVVLSGADFLCRPKIFTGLTRLTWSILVRYIPPLSYASLRDLALACPALEYLKLDGVFPILTEGVSYPKLHWDSLHTLELTMNQNPTSEKALANDARYVPDFLSLFSLPAIRVFTFESGWQAAWEELWKALPVLERTLPSIRTLRFAVTTNDDIPDVNPVLFEAFAKLRYLTIYTSHPRQFRHFLQPWGTRLAAADTAFSTGWPNLELLTLRGADGGAGAVDGEIADAVGLIESLHKARAMPLEVFWDTGYKRAIP